MGRVYEMYKVLINLCILQTLPYTLLPTRRAWL